MAEAYCFAHHFLCPRPLIHAVQQVVQPVAEAEQQAAREALSRLLPDEHH